MSIYEKSVEGNTVTFSEVTTTEVVANPDDEVTGGQLEKLKVGDTVYQAGISAEDSSKLERALKTPIVAPFETKLVSVDDLNHQVMLGLGDGLSISNGELQVDISSVPTPYVYRATITFTSNDGSDTFIYVNKFYTSTQLNNGYLDRLSNEERAVLGFFNLTYGMVTGTVVDSMNPYVGGGYSIAHLAETYPDVECYWGTEGSTWITATISVYINREANI